MKIDDPAVRAFGAKIVKERRRPSGVFLVIWGLILAACSGSTNLVLPPGASPAPAPSFPTGRLLTKFAVVADSHGDNENLKRALEKAKNEGAEYVVGLGDYTRVGTVSQLQAAKETFDQSGLSYFLIPGDHDLWDSRDKGREATANFMKVFGGAIEPAQGTSFDFGYKGVIHLMVDNSDVYRGLDEETWTWLEKVLKPARTQGSSQERRLPTFLFLHEPLEHPYLGQVMGRDADEVDRQRLKLLKLISQGMVTEVFAGEVHHFSRFTWTPSFPNGGVGVRMTTSGALTTERSAEKPSFLLLSVYNDGSYRVEKREI